MTRRLGAAVAIALMLAGPALAQSALEMRYGFAVTSNYIYKGTTQSNDNPALQGYVEGSLGMVYGGLWSSTVDFPADDDLAGDGIEFDLYAGLRHQLGDAEVDVSYYRYLYDETGDCCGEFKFLLGYPMADLGGLIAGYDYDPTSGQQWGKLGASLGFARVWAVDGTLGTDFGTQDLAEDKVAYDVGVNRGLGDKGKVDLRWYDSNLDPGHVVLTIGMDF